MPVGVIEGEDQVIAGRQRVDREFRCPGRSCPSEDCNRRSSEMPWGFARENSRRSRRHRAPIVRSHCSRERSAVVAQHDLDGKRGALRRSAARSSVSRLVWPYSADCTYQEPCGINSTEYLPGSTLRSTQRLLSGRTFEGGVSESPVPGWCASRRTESGGPASRKTRVGSHRVLLAKLCFRAHRHGNRNRRDSAPGCKL